MYSVHHQEECIRSFKNFFFLFTYIYHDAQFRNRKVCTIFLHFFIFQITSSNVWIDRIFQSSAQKLFHIRLEQIPLYFSIHFSFNNLSFTHINCSAMVQSLSDLNDHAFFWFGKKCVSAPDKLQSAVNNFTVTNRSHMKIISVMFEQKLSSVHYAFCSL
jgi:hypothetical protein